MEDDKEIDRLLTAVIDSSSRHGIPLYVETHRATITQDLYRTVKLTERNPDVRFNADFSHWYTGQEMIYGDIDAKFDFIEPVLARLAYMHARDGRFPSRRRPAPRPSRTSIPVPSVMFSSAKSSTIGSTSFIHSALSVISRDSSGRRISWPPGRWLTIALHRKRTQSRVRFVRPLLSVPKGIR